MKHIKALMVGLSTPLIVLACGGDTLPGQPIATGGKTNTGGESGAGKVGVGGAGSSGSTAGGSAGSSPSKGGSTHSGGGSTSTSSSGRPGSDCGLIECFRAVECVKECGGPVLTSGCCPCAEGTFDSIQCSSSGGAPSGGGTSAPSGGRLGTGGTAGTEAGGAGGESAGAGGVAPGDSSNVNPKQALADPKTPGTGACAKSTLGAVIKQIQADNPELADITRLYDPAAMLLGDGSQIYAFATAQGFKVVFVRGSGDCPAGCIDHEYWYFETDARCQAQAVGHYARIYSSAGNCFEMQGEARWSLPAPRTDGACTVDLSKLNTECVADSCPAGLTPVHFFGIAGPSGPEFCWCTIPCEGNPKVCPEGTACTPVSDGPGLVCYQ